MYGKSRSSGRGFRSNSMGMGAAASRISPDGPARGGFYSSEYRGFNRGYGRGQPKTYQAPQPVRRGGDLFMEAGRLAAEYLVAKGMLPQNALPGKWLQSGFKREVGDISDNRQQDGENKQVPVEGRGSALTRLGSSDGGSDRKRASDSGPTGSRNNFRGRRRAGSNGNNDSEWGQENGRSGSVSGRSKASSAKEADDDALSVRCEEQRGAEDTAGDVQNLKAVESAPKSDDAGNSEFGSEKHQPLNGLSSKTSLSAVEEDNCRTTSMECDKESDNFGNLIVEDGEMMVSLTNKDIEQQKSNGDPNVCLDPVTVVATHGSKNRTDLLQQCNFTKVPTRTRSMRPRGLKGYQPATTGEGDGSAGLFLSGTVKSIGSNGTLGNGSSEQTPPIGGNTSVGGSVDTELPVNGNVFDVSPDNAVSDKILDLASSNITLVVVSDQPILDDVSLNHAAVIEGSDRAGSLSFADSAFAYTQESSQQPRGNADSGIVNDLVDKERGEKRMLDENDTEVAYKRQREWSPPLIAQDDEYSHLSNLSTMEANLNERTSLDNNIMMVSQESSSIISAFPTLGNENSLRYEQDKQLIDGSFKICDLNLMEASDLNENHNGGQMMFYSSMSKRKNEVVPVNVDLTTSGNGNLPHQYNAKSAAGKEVEIIDLDNDFVDDRTFCPAEKREDAAVYTGLESLPNHAQTTTDNTDVQDGYGLMISELLGNEISNSSTVAADISSLHNNMDLHNGQGMLTDDDPIYMSLEEMPLSPDFWEPPNPDYGKPF